MSVSEPHPHYVEHRTEWSTARDVLRGQERIKARGTTYLPESAAQAATAAKIRKAGVRGATPYDMSKSMARIPDLMSAAVIEYTGLATRIPWRVENLPPAMAYLEENAGGGVPLAGWQGKLISEGLSVGRYGLLPDAPIDGGEARISWYPAESIINWRENDSGRLVLAVLSESVRSATADRFSHDTDTRYRVLEIVDGRLVAELWDEQGDTGESVPAVRRLDAVPLVIGGTTENGCCVERPPLMGVAESVLSYYRLSAQHRWALALTCNPTLLALGFEPGEITVIGAGAVVEKNVEPAKASMQYVEIRGSGIKHVLEEMDREETRAEQYMHRMKEKSGVQSGEAMRQEIQAKTASLKSIDRCAAAAFQQALNGLAELNNLPAAIEVHTALDYTDEDIDAATLRAISEVVERNQLPRRAVPEYAKSRGLLEEMTLEEIEAMVEEERDAADARSVGFGPFGRPFGDEVAEVVEGA